MIIAGSSDGGAGVAAVAVMVLVFEGVGCEQFGDDIAMREMGAAAEKCHLPQVVMVVSE